MSGSGKVAPWNAIPQAPLTHAAPGVLAPTAVQTHVDLPADSTYADRPLRGGVLTLSSFGEFRDGTPFTGGYRVMAGRPYAASLEGGAMEAQAYVTPAAVREAPTMQALCRSIPVQIVGADGMTGVSEV